MGRIVLAVGTAVFTVFTVFTETIVSKGDNVVRIINFVSPREGVETTELFTSQTHKPGEDQRVPFNRTNNKCFVHFIFNLEKKVIAKQFLSNLQRSHKIMLIFNCQYNEILTKSISCFIL